jgi:hypothetical protein
MEKIDKKLSLMLLKVLFYGFMVFNNILADLINLFLSYLFQKRR